MNKDLRGLTVTIGGDATNLGKALDSIRAKTSDSAAELSQINRLLKFDPGNTELLAQKQKVLADKIAATKEKITLLTEAQKQANEAVGSEKMTDANYRELQRAVVSAQQELSKLQNEADQTASTMSKAGKTTKQSGEQAAAGVKKVGEESDDATSKVSTFGDTLKAVLASSVIVAGAKAIWNGIKKIGTTAIESISALGDLSDFAAKVNMSAASLQTWQYAAKNAGLQNEDLLDVMKENQRAFASAKTGSEDLALSYAAIGIDVEKMHSSEEAFDAVIAKLSETQDYTTRNAVANKLFGESYLKLAPLLDLGKDRISDLRQEAKDLGVVITEDTVNAGDELYDTFVAIGQQTDAAKTKLLAGAIPALQRYSSEIKRTLGSDQAQKQLERTGKAIGDLTGDALSLATKVLPVLSNGLVFVSKNGKDLARTAAAVIVTFKGFSIAATAKTTIDALKTSFLGLNAAIKANPVGLMITAISGLVAIFGILDLATDSNCEQMDRLSESYRDAADAAIESQRIRAETLDGIRTEYDRYRDLVDELDTLVDADGRVKEGYEDRVNYIRGELSAATGVEIDLVDGVIQKYDDLRQSIEDVILKKQADAYLTASQGSYDSALSAVKSLEKDDDGNYIAGSQAAAEVALARYHDALSILPEIEGYQAQIDDLLQNIDYSNQADAAGRASKISELQRKIKETAEEIGAEEIISLKGAQEFVATLQQQADDAAFVYDQNRAVISQFEAVRDAQWADDVDALSIALSTASAAQLTASDATLNSLQRQLETAQEEYDQYVEWSKQENSTITEKDVSEKRERLISAALEAHKKLIAEGDAHTKEEVDASREQLEQLLDDVSDYTEEEISEMIADAEEDATEAGKHYVSGVVAGVTQGIQAAYDAGFLLGKAVDQGYCVATETESPSRVGYRSASWYPAGIAQGITDNEDLPVKAVARMSNRLTAALQTRVSVPALTMSAVGVPVGYVPSSQGTEGIDLQRIYGRLDAILASVNAIDPCLSIDGERMSQRLTPYTDRDLGVAAYNNERGRLQ